MKSAITLLLILNTAFLYSVKSSPLNTDDSQYQLETKPSQNEVAPINQSGPKEDEVKQAHKNTMESRDSKSIAYMAWNMVYNTSLTFDTPQERWVWVNKGIDLYLEAVKNNSKAPDLYWQLGWVFQHKMGMNLDKSNRYYKQLWAIKMLKLLKDEADIEMLAEATRSQKILHAKLARLGFKEFNLLLAVSNMDFKDLRDEILADPEFKLPATIARSIKEKKQQLEIVKFVKDTEQKRHDPETLFYLLKDVVDLKNIIASTPEKWDFDQFEKRFRELGKLPRAIEEALPQEPAAKNDVVNIIDSFMRDKWAWQVYHLDVRRMAKINAEYGNFDWRVAETHAIYWAKLGLEKDPKHVQCLRMLHQALQDVVDRGKLLYFKNEKYLSIDWTYNVDLVGKVDEILAAKIESLDESRRSTFETGYNNFLIDAVVAMYVYNRKKEAAAYYQKLKKRNSSYTKPLNEFVTPEVGEGLEGMNEDQARSVLEGFLKRSFQLVLYKNVDQAPFWFIRAVKVYTMFKDKTKNLKGRQGWTSSFDVMATRTRDHFITQAPERADDIQKFYNESAKVENFDITAINREKQYQNSQATVLANTLATMYNGNGKCLVIHHPVLGNSMKGIKRLVDAFNKGFGGKVTEIRLMPIKVINTIDEMTEEAMIENTAEDFNKVLKANTDCDMVILMVPLPYAKDQLDQISIFEMVPDEDNPSTYKRVPGRHYPLLGIYNGYVGNLENLFENDLVGAMSLWKPEPIIDELAVPDNVQEVFNKRYLLITSQNFESTKEKYPKLFPKPRD